MLCHRASHPELLPCHPLTPLSLQRLDLRLTGVAAAGALQLEVMRGGYISGSKVGSALHHVVQLRGQQGSSGPMG